MYSRETFYSERIAWRAVIYLNLVKSIRKYIVLSVFSIGLLINAASQNSRSSGP